MAARVPLFAQGSHYDLTRLRTLVGAAPKVRRLGKYRDDSLRRAYFRVENRLRRYAWHLRSAPPLEPVTLGAGTLLLLGGYEMNFRSAAIARALDSRTRLMAVIHDAIPIRRPDDAPRADIAFTESFNGLVGLGARILAVSNHAAADLKAAIAEGVLAPTPHPIDVLPLAAELRTPLNPVPAPPAGPYLLMVGPIHGRKNADSVFASYRRLIEAGVNPPRLVCAGRLQASSVAQFASGGRWRQIADWVSLVHQPDHATLFGLYRGALALIFPSVYEGYGLPLGEAQWVGTPVLASNATSLPEAGGEAPVYFDPTDLDALTALLRRLATDPSWVAELRLQTAAARPSLRSWRDCALALHAMAIAT
jgi:glycosyltransferase involved in cell wall biosynthesis